MTLLSYMSFQCPDLCPDHVSMKYVTFLQSIPYNENQNIHFLQIYFGRSTKCSSIIPKNSPTLPTFKEKDFNLIK